jgi:hypothetical protein
MTCRHFAVSAALVLGMSVPAAAFDIKYSDITLSYSKADSAVISPTFTAIDGNLDIGLGGNFGLQATLGYGKVDAPGFKFDRKSVALHPYFDINSQFRLGGYYEFRHFSASTSENSVMYYGVEGRYLSANGLRIEAFYGDGKVESTGLSRPNMGLSANYQFANKLEIGAYIDHEDAPTFGQLTAYGLSARFQFAAGQNDMPITVLGRVGRIDNFDGAPDFDTFDLSISIPLGKAAKGSARDLYRFRGLFQDPNP